MKRRVLIVEDEMIIAWDLKRVVEDLGAEVLGIASSADAAVAEAKRSAPDLILMDIVLKGLKTGLDAAREIRCFSDTPIVFLTGNANLPELAESGSREVISKPATIGQIKTMLSSVR